MRTNAHSLLSSRYAGIERTARKPLLPLQEKSLAPALLGVDSLASQGAGRRTRDGSSRRVRSEWMEARNQKTSRSMRLGAAQMLPLIFHDEPGSGMKRKCFFAHYGASRDAVGYATVDVDPDPTKVCHLRMLLVTPDSQRRGVGLAMLKTIFDCFATREIGLKYAKCHDYHKLYSAVGFKRIGDDDHYVYMALRRAKR